jgi:hypothetical protein
MANADFTSSQGVEIRRPTSDTAEVMIPIPSEGEPLSSTAVLARAWSLLAEAIIEEKKQSEQPAASQTEEDVPANPPPGDGAWWNG